jgi:hypothetical protein
MPGNAVAVRITVIMAHLNPNKRIGDYPYVCNSSPLLTSQPMGVEHEYRSDCRHQQISTANSVRSR